MVCVFGVLKTKLGLQIKDMMLSYLEKYCDILPIEQEPPGKLYEYPAILYACKTAVELNEPVLYIHTKGAANPNMWYQQPVHKMWTQEFGTDKIKKYFEKAEQIENSVVCPLAGSHKETWFNGFVISPSAAKILLKYLHFDKDRYYFEYRMCNIKELNVISAYDGEEDKIFSVDEVNKWIKEHFGK